MFLLPHHATQWELQSILHTLAGWRLEAHGRVERCRQGMDGDAYELGAIFGGERVRIESLRSLDLLDVVGDEVLHRVRNSLPRVKLGASGMDFCAIRAPGILHLG